MAKNGKYGMINRQSWVFLSSFEKLRTHLLETLQINSMLHLGPRTFDELSGEVVQNTAFVVTKHTPYTTGTYFRLVDGKNCGDKERMFLAGENGYPHVSQQNFEKIPEYRFGYWVSPLVISKWDYGCFDDSQIIIRQGLATGNNDQFIRLWHEIAYNKINRKATSCSDAIESGYKWFPFHMGGQKRSWYGTSYTVISFDVSSYRILLNQGNHLPSKDYYFSEGLFFSRISSKHLNAKYTSCGFIFDGSAPLGIAKDNLYEKLGYMCSNVITRFLQVLAPTLTFQVGDVREAAYINISNANISSLVQQNISISKFDWDAHETSWDFQENELVRLSKEQGEGSHRLSDLMDAYRKHWTEQFLQLHANEEELNRQFIEIYGLEDELTPDVPPEEITILQQGEIYIENGQIVWQNDVIVKQLISYAVGCMLGRYRLDKPGLHIAHPEPTAEEIAAYTFNGKQWSIDEDGILPLMPSDTYFADNATVMFKRWLVVAFGEDTLVDNLNCVEAALGKSLDDYFVKDFWKDHKKMYQNRPIYWLFSSKKGAFQCLAYMHRMNAYTAERIRTKYLLPHIEWLVQQQTEMETNAANLNARERKQLDSITRQIAECREYHDRLHTVADEQIAFDLDDGVVVNYGKFGDVLMKLK